MDDLIKSSEPRTWGVRGRVASAVDGIGPTDVAWLAWLALLVVGYVPDFTYPAWSSRAIILAAAVPLGTWRLCQLGRHRDPAALVVVGLLLVLLMSSWMGGNLYESAVGGEPTGQSLAFWWAMAAAWSLGRTSTAAVRSLAAPVIVAAVGMHLVIATFQLTLDLDSGPFAIAAGRPSGLATNPVYFGALAAMCTVYCAGRSIAAGEVTWDTATGIFATFVALSGSRAALVAMLLGLGVVSLGKQTGRIVQPLMAALGGIVVGTAIGAISGASSAAERTVSGSSGGRSHAWIAAWRSFVERPLFGWGPNRFRIAIQGRMPDEFVTAVDVSGAHAWTDPHNVVVSFAIGAGIVGVTAAIVFVWQASVGADRLLLASVGTIGLTWLLQPVFIVTGPIVFFLLGVAKRAGQDVVSKRLDRVLIPVLISLGLLTGTAYAVVDGRVARASDLFAEAEAWRNYRHDPGVADDLAERYSRYALSDFPYLSEEVVLWAETAVSYDPERATWWGRLSYWQLLFGDPEAAERSSAEALRLQPNEPQAWLVRRALASEGSVERVVAEERVCTLVPDQC